MKERPDHAGVYFGFLPRRRGETLEVCSQRLSLISAQTYYINLGTHFSVNQPQIVLQW